MSALYLSNQSVPNSKVFDAELMTCKDIKVCASAITTGTLFITFTTVWDLPSTAITLFLIDGFYFKPKIIAKGFVMTDMQAPVSKIAKIAFPLILV